MALPTRVHRGRGGDGDWRVTLVFTFRHKSLAQAFARCVDLWTTRLAPKGRFGHDAIAETIQREVPE